MRELADKLTQANLKAMADRGDVERLKIKIRSAQKVADESMAIAESLQTFSNELITDIRLVVSLTGVAGVDHVNRMGTVVGKPFDSVCYWIS